MIIYKTKNITATGVVKSLPGYTAGLIVNSGTPTIKIYDGVDNTGAVMMNSFVTTAGTIYRFPDTAFAVGLYMTLTGAGDVSVFVD